MGIHRGWVRAVVALMMVAATVGVSDASGVAAPGPMPAQTAGGTPNPQIPETCGINAVLVLDASGSIESSHAVDQVRDAGEAFLDALADTGSTARVLQFASLSAQLAPQTDVTQASVDSGVFRSALDAYYNPKPPRPANVDIYSYDGSGDAQSSTNWRLSNSSNQYTNWDQSLGQAGAPQTQPIDLVVYVTDGDPTAYDFDQPGDPFSPGPPPDVGVNTNRGAANALTMDRAVAAANSIKAGNARMLAVGVGSALQNPDSAARLVDIAGPQVVDDDDLAAIDSINDVDVALVEDFDDLAQFLRSVVVALCTPSIAISKYAQSPVTGEYVIANEVNSATDGVPLAWDITVAPTVAGGGTFTWTLPDQNPPAAPYACDLTGAASRTCPTAGNGVANFQWQPTPAANDSSAVVSETLQGDYGAGNPTGDDFTCRLKHVDGSVDQVAGEFAGSPVAPTFTVPTVDPRTIVTCAVYNHFDFQPAITLTKQDAPRSVRGDPEAASAGINETTSTFVVANPGNAPLFNVDLRDDRCNPVRDDTTDVGGDDMLDVGESWTFSCLRAPTSSAGSPDPVNIPNSASVHATDAVGNTVDGVASDEIEVYAPAIELFKTASDTQIPANATTPVVYDYTAVNTGNMPLANVSLTDDQGSQPCAPVVPVAPVLDPLPPGASQAFTCQVDITPAAPTDTFDNTAVVTGDPTFPGDALTPLGPLGDPVSAEASVVITSYTDGIVLTKAVDRALIFNDTEVNYTYTVRNSGSDDLQTVALTDDLAGVAAVNGSCTNIVGPGASDVGADGILSAGTAPDFDDGEVWEYTCATTIDAPDGVRDVLNVAEVTAVGVISGDTLVDRAPALVQIVAPEITIHKDATPEAVLDPDAIDPFAGDETIAPSGGAVRGPDVQPPRPAAYTYLVTNTGNVPIEDPSVADVRPDPPGGSACSPIEPVGTPNAGDLDGDGVLDPGEGWQFICEASLDKEQSDDPLDPTGGVVGVVNNAATATGTAVIPGATRPVISGVATASVVVRQPSISLQKTPCVAVAGGGLACDPDPDDADHLLVRPNTVVTYQYVVTNTGDSDFELQIGVDSLCPDIRYVSGGNGDATLTVGEQMLFECDYEVGTVADGPVVNDAGVVALGPLGNVYADVDQATVRIFDPSIELTKSVSEELVIVGMDVTYTFEVTNTGTFAVQLGDPSDVQLDGVLLADVSRPANPACTSPRFVGGDVAPLGVLTVEPAETWVYTCTGTITETTIDIAGVRGTDIQGGFVRDSDIAVVTAFQPGIDVVKSANPTELLGSGPVTYSYAVTNTGNVPLADVSERIIDDTCSPVTYVSGDDDGNELLTSATDIFETGPAETWNYTCTTVVSTTTTNTVVVTGTPVDPDGEHLCGTEPTGGSADDEVAGLIPPCDVTDDDQALVTVVDPGSVTVVKDADPNGSTVFAFAGSLGGFNLMDNGALANTRTFDGLTPGTYDVTESVTAGWQLESITCVDATGGTVTDVTAGRATISLAPGEHVTCTFRNVLDGVSPDGSGGGQLPSSGSATGIPAFLAGLTALLVGVGLRSVSRRRRVV